MRSRFTIFHRAFSSSWTRAAILSSFIAAIACCGFGLISAALAAPTILHRFRDTASDGAWPQAGIIISPSFPNEMDLYGTATDGTCSGVWAGCGQVFQLNLNINGMDWISLHNFNTSQDGLDPVGTLAIWAGNVYGATASNNYGSGDGQFYYLSQVYSQGTSSEQETIVHPFTGITTAGSDGNTPTGGLLQMGGAPTFYGVTSSGGVANFGMVYAFTKPVNVPDSWGPTTVYTFTGGADGQNPVGTLVTDGKGNLYGETIAGGITPASGVCKSGCGLIYELMPPDGGTGPWHKIILHAFEGGSDGATPMGGLTFDSVSGTLFGTTYAGGAGCGTTGCGTVFQLNPQLNPDGTRTENLLWSFCSGTVSTCTDAQGPSSPPVVIDNDGLIQLYGVAMNGGTNQLGAMYGLKKTAVVCPAGSIFGCKQWAEDIIWSFGGTDGSKPSGDLAMDKIGNIYGTARTGGGTGCGGQGCGVIYEITP